MTKIDHILASKNTTNKILDSQVITHALDLSDHNAIQLKISLEFEATNNIQSKKSIHKFDWKNDEFKKIFQQNVKSKFNNLDLFAWSNNDSINELIDLNIRNLTRILIKCARDAEKKQVKLKQKSNLNKQDPKIRYLWFKLKKLNYEDKLSNIKTTYHSIQYKNLKKEIRKLQRLNLSNKEKKKL